MRDHSQEIRKGHTISLDSDAVKHIPALHALATEGKIFKVRSVRRRGEVRVFEVAPRFVVPASWFYRVKY